MSYLSEKSDSLEQYAHRHFGLSGASLHLYRGMRWLERDKAGYCSRVRAGYRDIADTAGINVKSLKKALLELQEKGLVELAIGSSIKSDRKETEFRRKTLEEIKLHSIQDDTDADRLARALSARSFCFNGVSVTPMWTVGKTGRVMSSKPNIQGIKGGDAARVAGLLPGLKKGQALVHADIKAAEPTILKHLLGIAQGRDLYNEFMTTTGCPRSEAKIRVNTMAYCKNSVSVFEHWPESAQTELGGYVQHLVSYKRKLISECRKNRTVTTVTGRSIVAARGARLHAGQALIWRTQGTVADIINAACLRLLDSASVVIPLHDAIYAILPTGETGLAESHIVDRAREIGLTMEVKTEVYHG